MEERDFEMPLVVFENKDDKYPQAHVLRWQQFAERLCRYEERDSKDGKAWSPVTYLPNTTRGKANVDQVHALVLDIDHGVLPEDLLEGRELVRHETFQSLPEAPRWRVVLPLTRPVDGKDWPSFWLRANAYFGGCVDPATRDSSRIFYLPTCPPGVQHQALRQHGRLLDPDELPEVPEYVPSPRRYAAPSLLTRYLAEWAYRFAQAQVQALARMPRDSGRNAACNRAAYTLGGLVTDANHGLSAETVGQLLLEACSRNRLIQDDGQSSVEATIRSGLEAGLLRAWSPADREPAATVTPIRGHTLTSNGIAALVPQTGMQLHVTFASQVEPEPISWLWRNRLARGKATLLMGDPGLGKSLISHWLASIVSIGGRWPDEGECEQSTAILFGIEDALADTVVPRLMAAGADLDRVAIVQEVINTDDPLDVRMFALEEHIALLEALINQHQACLVVMDPVSAYLGANINAHKETDVRRVLAPLQLMAERTGVALLLLMHLTKGSGVSALYRATGSIAFPAVCRVVLGVAPDPNDETGKRRLLLPIKFNIAPDATGIGYHIETTRQAILPRADERDQPPILVWDDEPVLVDATTALDRTGTVQEMGALAECKAALTQLGMACQGKCLAREGERQLKEANAWPSQTTLVRARRELGIKASKDSFGGPWWWVWPEPTNKFVTRATPDTLDGLESMEPRKSPPADGSIGSENSKPTSLSRARVREGYESDMRYCPACERNLTSDAYEQHLPCVRQVDEELCPVHKKRWDLHECDAL